VVCVLQGICRNIVGEEQRGVAKVACLRKCRYGLRAELSPSSKGGPNWTFKGDPYRTKWSNQDPAVRPNGRVSRSIRDLGKGIRFGLASRASPTPQETDESQKY